MLSDFSAIAGIIGRIRPGTTCVDATAVRGNRRLVIFMASSSTPAKDTAAEENGEEMGC